MRHLLTAVFSLFMSTMASDAAYPPQARLELDIREATKKYQGDLHRFWRALDNDPEIKLQWHMVAYAAEFAQQVEADIIDAIIGDLRQDKTPYLGRARYRPGDCMAAFNRRQDYEGIISGLNRRAAKAILTKWLHSTNERDCGNAGEFLKVIRNREIAKQRDGTIFWQQRNFLQRWFF